MNSNQRNEMSDDTVHEYLKAQGAEWRSAMKLSPQLQQKCLAAMDAGRSQGRRVRDWGRRTLVSTMGLAAAIALVVTFAFPPNGNTPVVAKDVLAKLAKQVEGDGVLSVTFHDVRIDEVAVQGHLQIGQDSIAGDLHVNIQEEDDGPIEVDASLAVTADKGWVLVRKLQIPEPEAQAIIQMFVSPNAPSLIVLPDGIVKDLDLHGDGTPLADIRKLASGELAAIVREVVNSGADLGAVSTRQPDGTTRVTLRLKNAETIKKLVELAAAATGKAIDGEIEISEDDANELLGCTLAVDYDPQTQTVQSFSISDVAEMKGTISISLHEGGIDPQMLDSARVMTPNTRVIDTGFLKGLIEAAANQIEE